MKHLSIATLFVFALYTTVALRANAAWVYDSDAATIGDGNWTLSVEAQADGTYALSGSVNGSGELDLSAVESDTGIVLSSIAQSAFAGNTAITAVSMPDTIKSLGVSSFSGCSALTSVALSATLESIGGSSFLNCTSLETVTPFLPDTVRSMGTSVFQNDTALTGELVLRSKNLAFVWGSAFERTGITSVDMSGSGVTTISVYCFRNCRALTNVVLSAAVTKIDAGAFYNTFNLERVTPFFPETLETLGASAFQNDGIVSPLTGDVVLSCPRMTSVSYGAFKSTSITGVDMSGSSVRSIGGYAFNGCSKITNVVFSAQLESIGDEAFRGLSSPAILTPFLPDMVQSIGKNAFRNSAGITGALVLSSSNLVTLAEAAFYNSRIESADLSASGITSLSASVFQNCSSLTNVVFSAPITDIGANAFNGIPPAAGLYFLSTAPATIGENAFDTGDPANPAILYAARGLDVEGWSALTTRLTESDRASASYPGDDTFGVYVSGDYRHWLVRWESPLIFSPLVFSIR